MIEDDRTGMSAAVLRRAYKDNLYYLQGKDEYTATPHDRYMALAYTIRDRLIQRWIRTRQAYKAADLKRVNYLSAEFLMGRALASNLLALGITEETRHALDDLGVDLKVLLDHEPDAGLGNGGLGRLAACFLDSLATLAYPAMGYGLRYEYGIFAQRIVHGEQVEQPDEWLRYGNPWEVPRPEHVQRVQFGGSVEPWQDERGDVRYRWVGTDDVLGLPYDTLIPGYRNNTVNTLRLWSARAVQEFDFEEFDRGDYADAVHQKTIWENISKVLYPNDNSMQGKELRFKQQYFFVSCSIKDILRRYRQAHKSMELLPDRAAIQMNDTHPSIAIAELMRLLLDEDGLAWEVAWRITVRCFGYTNHTLLSEALEKWPVEMFQRLLPRHLQIMYEINRRFLEEIRARFPGDEDRVRRMSLFQDHPRLVRMAHLASVGSHSVNGVAALHSELLRTDVLRDFAEMWPERFNNRTNGVTPRRFLAQCNPRLARLLTEALGDEGWITDLSRLRALEPLAEDARFRARFRRIKRENKAMLADWIRTHNGLEVNLDSLFDVQVKRFHEYKRQHLNALHIVHLYNRIKKDPQVDLVPRTFIFAGKAAPGYFLAKKIIHLINAIGEVVNHDHDVAGRLKVVFLENYSVTLAERIIPAAELSEQISTAGKEASGTGNMKFGLNGALTVGTLDGQRGDPRAGGSRQLLPVRAERSRGGREEGPGLQPGGLPPGQPGSARGDRPPEPQRVRARPARRVPPAAGQPGGQRPLLRPGRLRRLPPGPGGGLPALPRPGGVDPPGHPQRGPSGTLLVRPHHPGVCPGDLGPGGLPDRPAPLRAGLTPERPSPEGEGLVHGLRGLRASRLARASRRSGSSVSR